MSPEEQRNEEEKAPKTVEWIYRGKAVSLKREKIQLETRERVVEIIHHNSAVVILPVTSENNILLIRQWRRAANEITIELPAGTLEKDEDPLTCAKRELQEETGFSAKTFRSMGGFFSAPGYCDEYLHLFCASDLYPSILEPDEDEQIEPFEINLKSALQMIREEKIRDAKTIAGILYYHCL